MKKHIKTIICLLLAASMLLGSLACTGNANGSGKKTAFSAKAENLSAKVTPAEAHGKAADQSFIAAQADFAVTLFKNSLNMQGNTLVSPLSVLLALAMTANGAEGETLEGMEKALGGISIGELNEYLYAVLSSLPAEEFCKVIPANSIWIIEGYPVEDAFLQKNADYYGAAVYRAPFDSTTVDDINGWVAANTDDMIKKIIDRIDEDTVMYLINALIFEAEWVHKYEKGAVRDAVFHTYGGGETTVQMMYSEEYGYIEDGDAAGFIKPYAGGRYSFAALLPNEGVDIYDYIRTLSGGKLRALLGNAKAETVSVGIPKFSCDYELLLNNALKAMGMERAFDPENAEFTRISEFSPFISRVIHKTFIEVGEQGTRAGAVTAVQMDCEGAVLIDHSVILDRPFVYMIIDNETNLPIFIGTLNTLG